MSPEKGGALRTESTGGRRAVFALLACGAMLGIPLLLLNGPTAVARPGQRIGTDPMRRAADGRLLAMPATSLVRLSVRAAGSNHPAPASGSSTTSTSTATTSTTSTTTTTAPPPRPHTRARASAAKAVPPTTSTTDPPPPAPHTATATTAPRPAPPTTTTTAAPPPPPTTTTTQPPAPAHSAEGQATWYAEAPPGYCASPFLSFGTRVEVVNDRTGASTSCVVDDRETAGPPRILDLSPSGFSQIAPVSQGVADVTISW
jgi:rare lipoprotein A (peptidoglycan hydrolase)